MDEKERMEEQGRRDVKRDGVDERKRTPCGERQGKGVLRGVLTLSRGASSRTIRLNPKP
jgi:hypothetical protein